jgi:TolB-like protein/Tfp pilus assembly protein PilF
VVITLAWYHGERASRYFSAAELTIISLLLVIGSVVFYAFVQPQQEIASDQAPPAQQTGVEAAKAAAASPRTGISLAVLPFANLSDDAGQEFFSDGITEEITSTLAKIADLRVVGRISAFQFKGQNQDLRAIGEALNATHLLSGSVRRAATRLRITAQLVQAENGINVWTETYDRELMDVFAIQEDIARAIATSLRMPLGLRPGDVLVQGTQNLGAYQEYLQAKAWYRDRNSPRSGPYLQTLENVVARDPGFSPAWAALSTVYMYQSTVNPDVPQGPIEVARRVVEENESKAEMAARKAIELDPRDPGGYAALAFVHRQNGEWSAAEDAAKQALAFDPNDPDVLSIYAGILFRAGRLRESIQIYERVKALEPLIAAYTINTALALHASDRNKEAIALLEAIPVEAGFLFREVYLARAYAAEARFVDASAALLRATERVTRPATRRALEDAARIIRGAPAKVADPQSLPRFAHLDGEFNFTYAYVGAAERLLDNFEREAQIRYMPDFGKTIWAASATAVRKSERFKAFARNAGLVAYWRERGWPDLCRPMGADDFVCD